MTWLINLAVTPGVYDSLDSLQNDTQTLREIILAEVTPKWNQYMALKNRRKEAVSNLKTRADTYRKKVIRDLREFYRILFRKRFHLSEYKTAEGIKTCLRTFFDNLGFQYSQEDLEDYQLFRYLHQTHQCTSTKLVNREEQERESPFLVVEKYNDRRYKKFISNPLWASMLYFAYKNFLADYLPFVKTNVRDKVEGILREILDGYHSWRSMGDLKMQKFEEFYKKLQTSSVMSKPLSY